MGYGCNHGHPSFSHMSNSEEMLLGRSGEWNGAKKSETLTLHLLSRTIWDELGKLENLEGKCPCNNISKSSSKVLA